MVKTNDFVASNPNPPVSKRIILNNYQNLKNPFFLQYLHLCGCLASNIEQHNEQDTSSIKLTEQAQASGKTEHREQTIYTFQSPLESTAFSLSIFEIPSLNLTVSLIMFLVAYFHL